jgi:soluble lytic murein transglycosylase-like protein
LLTRLPALGRKTTRRPWLARWGQAKAAVLPALLVIGLVALLSASTARNETLAAQAAAGAALAPEPAAPPAAEPAARPAIVAEPDVEAVAGAVARRYRISQDATRVVVGTAYGEGRRVGLDPLLIVAVIAVESRFNPIAQSDGGAVGLMQVIPRYHVAQFAAGDGESVLDPRTNIELGARVLKAYIRQGGTEVAGLQLYNGASADTSNGYANKVLGERARLQELVRRSHERTRA